MLGLAHCLLTFLHIGSIENYGINRANVASEFVAQYSSRQKYRYPVVVPALESSGFNFGGDSGMCFGVSCLTILL